MYDRDRSDDSIPTLLDKATEVEDIAAGVILAKLDKLRRVEEIVKDKGGCCAHCDSVAVGSIRKVLK